MLMVMVIISILLIVKSIIYLLMIKKIMRTIIL
ncbi:hypothetical protein ABVB41_00845 [Staphylococcus cohnii]